MDTLSPKERIFRVFDKKTVDRPPVICPGGMMNAAIAEVMTVTGHTLPEAHHDDMLMAALSEDIHNHTGFENFGIPFCMTVEAEVLGSEINFGTLNCEPKIQAERFADVSMVEYKDIGQMLRQGRISQVIQAGWRISCKNADVPVIGNLTGPVSATASLVDPMNFLKGLRKNKSGSHKALDYVTNFLIAYALLMIEGGVSVISIGDPTATGEILGPKMFEEYAVTYLNKLIDGIRQTETPVIVHICGNLVPYNKQFLTYNSFTGKNLCKSDVIIAGEGVYKTLLLLEKLKDAGIVALRLPHSHHTAEGFSVL